MWYRQFLTVVKLDPQCGQVLLVQLYFLFVCLVRLALDLNIVWQFGQMCFLGIIINQYFFQFYYILR